MVEKARVLSIDMDEPCPRCGKKGSVNGGLCLDCAVKAITETLKEKQSKIGAKSFVQILGDIRALLIQQHLRINEAYILNDDELTLSISVKVQPHKRGGNLITTALSFTKEKIKEAIETRVDESQIRMFDDNLILDGGSGED